MVSLCGHIGTAAIGHRVSNWLNVLRNTALSKEQAKGDAKRENLMHIHINIDIYTGSHGTLQRIFNNFSEQ